ncbi:endonuclease [Flavobacterium davisii]|uniref:site-specific DNA-methyltransferase (adenine-specific) n=1 Tax=Flavobacterium davisii TaxID=2906077 RepID=A0A246GI71_9FLAO|nr:N-6 DNA methylase [Flavobacterium davisii]OWP83931.1 endonuclease [Flavobacterium davisii]
MAYIVTHNKQESFEQLKKLIIAFNKEYAVYKTDKYKEAQLRIDFLNPLLKIFGWDVDNEEGKSQFLRDIIQEESIDVDDEDVITKKNPDYTLRIQGVRKVFIEAKKASIDLSIDNKAAFQTRRYGWNANLGISILTNFDTLVVYDCRYKPSAKDIVSIARYKIFHYSEFEKFFDELYDLLSFESIANGYIEEYFSLTEKETTTFDDEFLRQIEHWRESLAKDVVANNPEINNEEINFLIQRLLNRIVFLRICEDREIEKFETLRKIKSYDELKELFRISDKKYNSGLFDFIEDIFSLKINLNSEILIQIFNELYYPQSPYDFSIVDPTILSQIYERYLGSKIFIGEENQVFIVEEPEVAASNGVVPTPKLVVKSIIEETLSSLINGKSLDEIQLLKIADICCGSGTFLISVYDYLIERNIVGLVSQGVHNDEIIYQTFDGTYHLTLKAKHQIIKDNIFGVDINPYAVEVTKFSLLLKLLENENAGSINNFLVKYNQKVLPNLEDNIKCGNSLVDNTYFEYNPDAIENDELLFKLKPFNWLKEFPFLVETNGFDALVGNPPYVRIQNIVKYSIEEIDYFQSDISGYKVATSEVFDKYYLFIQRAISLINDNGVLGYIVPHKFFIIKGGKSLRSFITTSASLFKILHFGVTQVFPNRSTYTAILILDKKEREKFYFKRIRRITSDLSVDAINYDNYLSNKYQSLPWVFVSKPTEVVFERIGSGNVIALQSIAEIAVGLQTSADKTYIFQPLAETESTYIFESKGIQYEVEKDICKPCLYDLSFGLFDTVEHNAKMLFPYTIVGGKAEVFTEEYFEQNYPLAWAYLNIFKTTLSKRSINGSKEPKWYQFGRSQSLTRFHNTPKLIWSVLSTKPGYVYDQENLQFTGGGNGPYYSLFTNSKYSLFYILGILAHPVIEAMVKSGASEFRGAYYSHGKQFIENLPIRKIDFDNLDEKQQHDDIVKTVKQLINTKSTINQETIYAKRNILKCKMDTLYSRLFQQINLLYNISDEDVNVVMSDEMLNNIICED